VVITYNGITCINNFYLQYSSASIRTAQQAVKQMAYSNYMDCETSYTLAGVKCGSADVRILNMQNADVVADENPHFTHTCKPKFIFS